MTTIAPGIAPEAVAAPTRGDGFGDDPDRYPQASFDMVKEAVISIIVVAALVLGAAVAFGAPWVKPLTIKTVANGEPLVFLETAANDLAGTSAIAQYGPPYNHFAAGVQGLGWFHPQTWLGVTQPINPPTADVIKPLQMAEPLDPAVAAPLATWSSASTAQRNAWTAAYLKALASASVRGGHVVLPAAPDGPVPAMLSPLRHLAAGGLLSGALDRTTPVYRFNVAPSLLFLQGKALHEVAEKRNLLGEQWGIMHDEAAVPGPWWLTPYTFLYQVPPFNTSPAGDLEIAYTMLAAFALLVAVPFIPGLRELPRKLGAHRIIWRDWYRDVEAGNAVQAGQVTGTGAGEVVTGGTGAGR